MQIDELGSVDEKICLTVDLDSTNVEEKCDMDTTSPSDEEKGSCQIDVADSISIGRGERLIKFKISHKLMIFQMHTIRHNKPKKAHVTSINAEGMYLFI